jgi:transglutaminase-like putative cysteine protease
MKDRIVSFLTLLIFVFSFSVSLADSSSFDLTKVNQGVIGVSYQLDSSSKYKLMVQKGNEKYYYDLVDEKDYFPLQMGSGKYKVSLMKNTTNNKYTFVETADVLLENNSENNLYLSSIQVVDINENSKAVLLAKDITAGLETDQEKFQAIYQYVITNISYDYDKIGSLGEVYIPRPDQTLSDGKGICYDYSSLLAVMLRSVGIKTKLVKGYAKGISSYHAWNEVFIDGEWKVVDTTSDSAYANKKLAYNTFKTESSYDSQKVY